MAHAFMLPDLGEGLVTFDHRVIDGARAGAFCLDLIGRLEVPSVH